MSGMPPALRLGIAAGAFLALLATAWALVRESQTRFDALSSARSDNVQWVLAQVEVEYLALDVALLRGAAKGAPVLPEVRLRFDIFYSRVETLRRSPLFAELREDAAFGSALRTVRATLEDAVPLIDGSDAALLGQIGALEGKVEALREPVRRIGLAGLAHFAEASDQRREAFLGALRDLAGLTAVLMAGLVVLVAVLWRALRVRDAHARDARLSAARRSAVVSSALDAVIVADGTGRVLEANAAVERVFGYPPDALIGRPMEDTIIPPHLRAAHRAGMARYARTGEPRVLGKGRVQLEALHREGHTFPVELSIATARSDDGELFVSFLRDITHRIARETELRAARDRAEAGEKSKARMLATMSHEMRTPLNGILGTLELLEGTDPTPRQARYLKVMRSSGDVLLHHINDVLDISRLDAGKVTAEKTVFALTPLLETLVDSQTPLAEQRGNTLDLVPLAGSDIVLGDPARLRQILLNLLGNAIKFTEGGAIALEAERTGESDEVEFRIADTGPGIPEDQQARIFEDFVTLDASYGRVHGGTGLGLGIVRRMVDALGGSIAVESAPGEGSLFRVRLPLPAAERRAADRHGQGAVAGEVPPVPPRSVLIVEDNGINRMILREMLVSLGQRVTEAEDGQAGVEAASARRYDLILMDISMPRMDGVTAARLIRESDGASRAAPIVALTAHAMPADIDRFAAAGMTRTVVKPASRRALARVLADLPAEAGDPPRGAAAPPDGAPDPSPVAAEMREEVRAALGDATYAALVDQFVRDTDAAIAWLTGPDAPGAPREAVLKAVHDLAGTCGLLGAVDLQAALSGIEARAKDAAQDAIDLPVADLVARWERARPHFVRHRGDREGAGDGAGRGSGDGAEKGAGDGSGDGSGDG